ncbi:hypothetical protein ES705_30073 [subsurface metagenome]
MLLKEETLNKWEDWAEFDRGIDYGYGLNVNEGEDNWDPLYYGYFPDSNPEWTLNVEGGTLTGSFIGRDFVFPPDPWDDSISGAIQIMTLTEDSWEFARLYYNDPVDPEDMEVGLIGAYEVSGDTMTIELTEINIPEMGMSLKPGDYYWYYIYDMLTPYLGLTITFSVDGDQLSTTTQLWDDWINDIYEETTVYTRLP